MTIGLKCLAWGITDPKSMIPGPVYSTAGVFHLQLGRY